MNLPLEDAVDCPWMMMQPHPATDAFVLVKFAPLKHGCHVKLAFVFEELGFL